MQLRKLSQKHDVEILPEIHEHYTIPMKIARQGFWIYDFALPVLTLHGLYNHTGVYLKRWLEMCPMKQFTTLDTHDGIGIVDVKDLLPDEAIETVKEQMYRQGANVKKIYSSEAYNNLDVYQVNTTYYSALGNGMMLTCWREQFSFLHREFHKCIMWGFLPEKMIWN